MSSGNPIVFTDNASQRKFTPLLPISTRRDDPGSFQEKLLQELIDSSPNVLPVRDFLPSTKALFSLGREIPVDIGGSNGYIDNLLVTNDGYLVIVETKLYRNPEATREVVTQTLQYGMDIGRMSMAELEARIKRGQNSALRSDENIRSCVARLAADSNLSGLLTDDFEESFEGHLRRGEILLLVASDAIHIGVERITHWLNDQGSSSPFKFGLVELKFYTHGNERLVIPRTILKTREVSRHVVVVDIRPNTDVSTSAEVIDEYRNTSGGKVRESRSVKTASAPMSKSLLAQQVAPDGQPIVSQLIDQLEAYGLDQQGTGSYLRFGLTFPEEGGEFHPLVYLGKEGVWAYPLKQIRELLGSAEMTAFHQQANAFGKFFRDDQINKPESTGCAVKYTHLQTVIPSLAAFFSTFRTKMLDALQTHELRQ